MTAPGPLSLKLYRAAAGAVAPLATPWLIDRVRRGKEDPTRWRERLGFTDRPRPDRPLIWLHGVSVGETLSLLPLAASLGAGAPDAAILVTSGTRAAAEVLNGRLPAGVTHQFAPLDTPGAVGRFLDHWRPRLVILVESELWPNLILGAKAGGARLALVSAKLSERSAEGWKRAPAAARAVLGAFDLILARDLPSSARLTALGARVDGLADLKFGTAPLPADPEELVRLRGELAGRPVILAASTHPGEDAVICRAFRSARSSERGLLLLAPRHPERGEAMAAQARGEGAVVTRRALGERPGGSEIYVADTLGELGLWYRLANLAVIGGSLASDRIGGHNPLEPARLGCPFIAGPGVAAWPIYADLEIAGATALVGPDDLAAWFTRALDHDPRLADMASRASGFIAPLDGLAREVADRLLALCRR